MSGPAPAPEGPICEPTSTPAADTTLAVLDGIAMAAHGDVVGGIAYGIQYARARADLGALTPEQEAGVGATARQNAAVISLMVTYRREIDERKAKIQELRERALIYQQRRRGLEYERDDQRRTGFWNALEDEAELTFIDTPVDMWRGFVQFTENWRERNDERFQQALEDGTPFAGPGAYLESFGEVTVESIEQALDFTEQQIEELLAANGAAEAAYHALGAGLGLFEATMGAGGLASPLAAATDLFMAGGGGVGPLLGATCDAGTVPLAIEADALGAPGDPLGGGIGALRYEHDEIAEEYANDSSRTAGEPKCVSSETDRQPLRGEIDPRTKEQLGEGPEVEAVHETNAPGAGVRGEHPRPGEGGRPSARDTEVRAAKEYEELGPFVEQQSMQEGKAVRHGTKESTRPDLYSRDLRMSIDAKNYNIATRKGRTRLVRDVVNQARLRAGHLPPGTRQALLVETRGLQVSPEILSELKRMIAKKSGGLIAVDNIGFIIED